MGISIIILSYNNLNYTKQCLESIKTYTTYEEYEIIVVDNNSNEETKKWLMSQDNIKLKINDTNRGFACGCNDGIKIANKENDILLLNNDTVVTKNWLKNLRIALYSDDNIGIVAPVTNSASYEQSIPISYNNISEMQDFAAKFNESNKLLWEERAKVIGFCMLIKRSVLNKVGLLDESYILGHYEDDDYCMRVILEGYKIILCHDTFIHHYGTISFKENPLLSEIVERNCIRFFDKWGFISYIELDFNHNYLSVVEDKENLKVLDVYSNSGSNGLMLKYHRKNLECYIIKNDLPVYKIASKLNKIYDPNNEIVSFDYLIINDTNKFLEDKETQEIVSRSIEYTKNIVLFFNIDKYKTLTNDTIEKLLSFLSCWKNKFNFNNRNIFFNKESNILIYSK